jgi:16S rRNA (cytidine1402-2'-O)-methyltransferase
MSKLFLVPTPIGNLEDITLRALRILKEVDFILAEDTRTSRVLLNHFNIEKQVRAYHQHNEHQVVQSIVERVQDGHAVALITDAGTPGISDPGFLIVRECIRAGVEVECLPGPTAFVPALVNSGLPSERFCFEGFLPQKKGRATRLEQLKQEDRTMVFYESPFRLVKTLEQFCTAFGTERQASVSRELTKFFEETKRGSLQEVCDYFKLKTVKGELVIVVAGKEDH